MAEFDSWHFNEWLAIVLRCLLSLPCNNAPELQTNEVCVDRLELHNLLCMRRMSSRPTDNRKGPRINYRLRVDRSSGRAACRRLHSVFSQTMMNMSVPSISQLAPLSVCDCILLTWGGGYRILAPDRNRYAWRVAGCDAFKGVKQNLLWTRCTTAVWLWSLSYLEINYLLASVSAPHRILFSF